VEITARAPSIKNVHKSDKKKKKESKERKQIKKSLIYKGSRFKLGD
jgi:hypothetical protein